MGRVSWLYIIILIGIYSCVSNKYEETISVIEQVKNEYAPDSRTAIFDIYTIDQNPISLKGETNLPDARNQLINSLQSKGIDIEDAITILPNPDLGAQKYGLINVSVANFRAKPKHSAELVTQALLGTPVKLLKAQGGWLLMQTPDKYIAWSNSVSIINIDSTQLDAWKKSPKIIYLDTYGFSIDKETGKRVSDLVAGNIMMLKNEKPDYWEVEYPDGRNAVVAKKEASDFFEWKNNVALTEISISTAAKDLMGIPYLWGGTSTKGLDCSGFTKTVYFLQGLVIPRDASQQVHVGELVDQEGNFSKLEVGDLLFFGTKNEDQTERVVHVGLWLGNNQFIHASGDVHISSMDSLNENFDRYNFERYLRTKRIIGSSSESKTMISDL